MISTTEIDYITTINETFANNRIAFRAINCRNGILYLCKTSFGQTFNLHIRNNQSIKIWSFIGTTSIDRAGTKYEWKNENDSYPIGGIEITDDGDLSFYMTDILAIDEPTVMDNIQKIITTYVNMLPNILSRSFKL